jgi:hypothetical protein
MEGKSLQGKTKSIDDIIEYKKEIEQNYEVIKKNKYKIRILIK